MAAGRPNGARSVGKAIKSLDFDSTEVGGWVGGVVGGMGGWVGGCTARECGLWVGQELWARHRQEPATSRLR